MTSAAVDFLKPVFPAQKVTVLSEKVYFKFNKLNCKVQMENEEGEMKEEIKKIKKVGKRGRTDGKEGKRKERERRDGWLICENKDHVSNI